MKLFFTITACLIFLCPALAEVTYYNQNATQTLINNGIGLGAVIAVVTSWSRNRSVAWAILHGIIGWLYVIYFVLTREQYTDEED